MAVAPAKNATWGEWGLYWGTALTVPYLAYRGAKGTQISVPFFGHSTLDGWAGGAAGAGVGFYFGPAIFYRAMESLDGWLAPVSEQAKYPWRYRFLKVMPSLAIAGALYLLNEYGLTDGASIFAAEGLLNISVLEQEVVTSIYAAYVGATAAVRFGNMIERAPDVVRKARSVMNTACAWLGGGATEAAQEPLLPVTLAASGLVPPGK